VKRSEWRRVFQGQCVVGSPQEFASIAEQACTNINVMFISSSSVEEDRNSLETDRSTVFHNLYQAHTRCILHERKNPGELGISSLIPFHPGYFYSEFTTIILCPQELEQQQNVEVEYAGGKSCSCCI
jgi:hypothetical protein